MPVTYPYHSFRFDVEIAGFARASFSKIEGLVHNVEQIEYREGGDWDVSRKLPGMSTFDPLVFERGISADGDFIAWLRQILDAGNFRGTAQPPEDPTFRRDGHIFLRNKSGARVKQWTWRQGWPSKVEFGSLDANANEVLIERIEIVHEGFSYLDLAGI